MKRLLPALMIATLMGSCSGGYTYEKHIGDFPNKIWKKKKVLAFSPKITDTSATYNVLLDFRHVYGFSSPKLKLQTSIKSPAGKTNKKEHRFPIIKKASKEGKPQYLSSCSGDLCDRTVPLFKGKKFDEEGKYRIEIRQAHGQRLPNVMKVGLMLQKNMKGEDVVIQKKAVQ